MLNKYYHIWYCNDLRDRPFNLQGEGGEVWFFVSFIILFSDNTRVRMLICFVVQSAIFFLQNSTLGYVTKTLNQIFFFPPPKSEYFFQQHWESEYFFKKKNHKPPPFKLNGPFLKYVDIVNAELIESTLKQTRMCSCFNDFLWLSKYKKCCVHLIFIDCFI